MEIKERVVLYAFRDREGKVLLQHRTLEDPKLPNHWGLFGGEIEGTESPKQAVLRHAKAELSIEPKLEFFRRYELPDRHGNFREFFVFTGPLKHDLDELRELQLEGDNVGLFRFSDFKSMLIDQSEMVILRDIFNEAERVGLLEVEK